MALVTIFRWSSLIHICKKGMCGDGRHRLSLSLVGLCSCYCCQSVRQLANFIRPER